MHDQRPRSQRTRVPAGLAAVEGRTWEAAMAQLAAGYERSLRSGARKPGPAPLQEVA